MFYSIFGSLLALTIPLMIVGSFSPENAGKVLLMGAIFGLISALPLLLVFATTREKQEFVEQIQPTFKDSLKAAFKNKPFVFGAVIYLITWVSFDILLTVLLFFIKFVMGREADSDLIMAVIFIVAIFALPFWEWTSRKLNKRLAYAAGIAFWAVVQVVLITMNASSPLTLILFLCGLAGICVSAAHILPWSIIPDAIEWDEYQTGERHEGMFYSLVTLMQKIASSIAIPLTAIFLDLTHYVPNSATQPASALLGIRILVGPIPAVLLIIGIIFALKYPLSREEFTRVVKELHARRLKGKV
jgi:GPH family glycoside/pentoside/hexuronide:cation symporter